MLLFQLVQTFNEEDQANLQSINLTPTEHKLLHYCLGIRHKKLFAPTPALNKLKLSNTYMYKLSSVVLSKVLAHLYGNDFNAQVAGLSKKIKLVSVVRHLMKIRERLLLKETNTPALLNLYETCFEFERTAYSSDYDKRLVTGYFKKCLKYAGKKADEAYKLKMQVDMLAAEVNVAGANGCLGLKKVQDGFQKRFDTLCTTAVKPQLYNLMLSALSTNAVMYLSVSKPELALPYLERATEVVNTHGNTISERHKVELYMLSSRALYFLSRFAEAYDKYSSIDIPAHLNNGGIINADIAKFIQVCLITGHYAKAKELLENVFGRIMDAQNSAGIMAQLHNVKYMVYTAQYKQALTLLGKLDKLVRSFKIWQYMMEVRLLYTISQLLSANTDEAFNSAERTLKFLYSKKKPEEMADFIEAFQLLKALAKGNNLSLRLQGVLHKYQYNSYMQYGQLFNRIMAST